MAEYTTRMLGEVQTIALATDGSKSVASAEQEAFFLCRTWKARLVILTVITIDTELATSVHAESATLRMEINDHVEHLKKEAADKGIDCRVVIEETYIPENTIIELARKHRADMIVMGRHERGALMKLLTGSVTSKVIGLGFPKVMVVPSSSRINVERILLATDGSEFSRLATAEALNLGKHCSCLEQLYPLAVAAEDGELKEAQDRVDAVCAEVKKRGLPIECIPIATVGSRPAEIITDAARLHQVGMIIMGGHGRGLTKLLMGHVTEKVISQAHCAVLVIEK